MEGIFGTWTLTHEVGAFWATAGEYLTRDLAANTVLVTAAEAVRERGPVASAGGASALFGWELDQGGAVVAGFVHVPPHGLLLGVMGAGSAQALGKVLEPVSRAEGEAGTVRAFAEASSRPWRVFREERLFELDEVADPGLRPAGEARAATLGDSAVLERWFAEYAEVIGEDPSRDFRIVKRIDAGRLLVWQDEAGRPVSMVGRSARVAGQVRIAPVYTPAELRGRGYAGALVADASRSYLKWGADQVLLFTDLANPTSNALYQRIGYRPIADHSVLEFMSE